jgi:hypothetical protein
LGLDDFLEVGQIQRDPLLRAQSSRLFSLSDSCVGNNEEGKKKIIYISSSENNHVEDQDSDPDWFDWFWLLPHQKPVSEARVDLLFTLLLRLLLCIQM